MSSTQSATPPVVTAPFPPTFNRVPLPMTFPPAQKVFVWMSSAPAKGTSGEQVTGARGGLGLTVLVRGDVVLRRPLQSKLVRFIANRWRMQEKGVPPHDLRHGPLHINDG